MLDTPIGGNMEELYKQFEKEAIAGNFSISFAKSEGRYFHSITQSMFEGWHLCYRNLNRLSKNKMKKIIEIYTQNKRG